MRRSIVSQLDLFKRGWSCRFIGSSQQLGAPPDRAFDSAQGRTEKSEASIIPAAAAPAASGTPRYCAKGGRGLLQLSMTTSR
jgi:hypothetical protein